MMPDRQQLRGMITDVVTRERGCKGIELVTKVTVAASGTVHGSFLLETVERMVKEGELVEVVYVLPESPLRTKSFFLPKGSTAGVVGHGSDVAAK